MSTILTYVALICLLVLLLIYLNGWNINSVIKEGLNDEASSFVVTMTNNDSGSVSSSDIFDNAKKDNNQKSDKKIEETKSESKNIEKPKKEKEIVKEKPKEDKK